MRVLVTGANGFIGKNLCMRINEVDGIDLITFTREDQLSILPNILETVDWVFHLAGVNRPLDSHEFAIGNVELTEKLCSLIRDSGRKIPIVFTSSIHAENNDEYGRSKQAAEKALLSLKDHYGFPVIIYRLPNIFGKFARPNYNSVVATFCHRISRNLPIHINDESANIRLMYIDDLVENLINIINRGNLEKTCYNKIPEYNITVGELFKLLQRFENVKNSLTVESVGIGLMRALYSTYLSYLPPKSFTYQLPQNRDTRGVFVEMIKTKNAGQVSFFTALPGITRGGHYHHSKNEKFLVVKGKAHFSFRHMITGEFYELFTSSEQPEIVITAPGWIHDITNIGEEEMICMLWANEIFDVNKPDTINSSIVN
jgi:UDP-2-acetamido-2,6-beta-L-arabino-hexul-4-ose reductase